MQEPSFKLHFVMTYRRWAIYTTPTAGIYYVRKNATQEWHGPMLTRSDAKSFIDSMHK